jgi:hypothetical protein
VSFVLLRDTSPVTAYAFLGKRCGDGMRAMPKEARDRRGGGTACGPPRR